MILSMVFVGVVFDFRFFASNKNGCFSGVKHVSFLNPAKKIPPNWRGGMDQRHRGNSGTSSTCEVLLSLSINMPMISKPS